MFLFNWIYDFLASLGEPDDTMDDTGTGTLVIHYTPCIKYRYVTLPDALLSRGSNNTRMSFIGLGWIIVDISCVTS
jgi:hypothetical protein